MKDATRKLLDKVATGLEAVATAIREETNEILLTSDPIEVVKHFNELRLMQDRMKIARKAYEEIVDDLSIDKIPTLFTNRSLKTINIEGVGRATVSYRWSASIIDDPKRGKLVGHEWLKANGYGSMVTETVNSSSLAAFAKEMMQADEELPPDIFKVGQAPYTSITKA